MQGSSRVTANQLWMTMCIFSYIALITYGYDIGHQKHVQDIIPATIITFFLDYLVMIPILIMSKRNKDLGILEIIKRNTGKFSYVILAIYALYFLFTSTTTLDRFDIFTRSVFMPEISIFTISVFLIIICVIGASFGFEAIIRSSVIIFALSLISTLIVIFSPSEHYNFDNLSPMFYNGYDGILKEVSVLFSRSHGMVMMMIFFPHCKGKKIKSFVIFHTLISVLFILTTISVILCFGKFADIQPYPYYALMQLSQIGSLKKVDAIFASVLILSYVIKMCLIFYVFEKCIFEIFKVKAKKLTLGFLAVFLIVFSYFVDNYRSVSNVLFNPNISLAVTLLVLVVIPVFLLFVDIFKKRGNVKDEKVQIDN